MQQKVDAISHRIMLIHAAKEATKTIPIVMISSIDPVAAGYVESFGHPGGNIMRLAGSSRYKREARNSAAERAASQVVQSR